MIKENHKTLLKLQEAAKKSQIQEINLLEEEVAKGAPYVFSDEFNTKMDKLLRFSKKPYFNFVNTAGKRAAVIIIAFITALSITTFSVKALREPVVSFIVSAYEKFSNIVFYTEPDETSIPTKIEQIYRPEYIPNGYVEVESINLINFIEITYSNGKDDLILTQVTIGSAQFGADTEGTKIETLIVDGMEVLFYSNKGINRIIWTDGLYSYRLSGIIDKNELIKMVNTTKF